MGARRRPRGSGVALVDSQALAQWAGKIQHLAAEVPLSILGLQLHDLPKSEDVCSQGQILVRDFIFHRLQKHGLLTYKLELQSAPARRTDVAVEIRTLAAELEKMYPTLYQSVSNQLHVTLTTDHVVRKTFLGVADYMFKHSVVTWGRIVALFAVAGALAVESVQAGRGDLVRPLVDAFGEVTQRYLAAWITKQGGWTDVTRTFKIPKETSTLWTLTGIGAFIGFIITMATTFGL